MTWLKAESRLHEQTVEFWRLVDVDWATRDGRKPVRSERDEVGGREAGGSCGVEFDLEYSSTPIASSEVAHSGDSATVQ